MSNSHEQSLNEDVVFWPVLEGSPEFLHSEGERCAVECLLSDGPGAFYTTLNSERVGPFLSPDEVNQISSWAEDYHISELLLEEEDAEEEGSSGVQDFSACYFPVHSDTPAPCLELGWPEKLSWTDLGHANVYTSPPVEHSPPIRQVARSLLQGAGKVIAVVTDRLTDSAAIGDLHNAASRGVPVYIIMNRRSAQENFTNQRLKHPNIRVRVLGGKTFCSRDGRMVVGELKDNFVLVDLETVMQGSYSLTWADAHLHRHIVTVMSGPVVEAFDQEFRTLYAASLPISEAWKSGRPATKADGIKTPQKLPGHLDLDSSKAVTMDMITSPPPPPTDSMLDWEALGVFQRDLEPESPVHQPALLEGPLKQPLPTLAELSPVGLELGPKEVNAHVKPPIPADGKRHANIPPETRNLKGHSGFRQPLQMEVLQHSNEVLPRTPSKPDRMSYRHLSSQPNFEHDERVNMFKSPEHRLETIPRAEFMPFSSRQRRDPSLGREDLEESFNTERPGAGITGISNAKKPLILMVPQTENFSTLSDIMKKINPSPSSAAPPHKGAASGISKSMLDLSVHSPDKASSSGYDDVPLTPALALMKKRNDEIKSSFLRGPKTFLPPHRPRSSSFGLQREWRAPMRNQRSTEEK